MVRRKIKVNNLKSLFQLNRITLPKCTRFSSTRKLEVADKYFGPSTKNYFMHWQMRGLKDSISGNIWVVSLNSNFACGNRYTQVILLLVGPQQSLLMIIDFGT